MDTKHACGTHTPYTKVILNIKKKNCNAQKVPETEMSTQSLKVRTQQIAYLLQLLHLGTMWMHNLLQLLHMGTMWMQTPVSTQVPNFKVLSFSAGQQHNEGETMSWQRRTLAPSPSTVTNWTFAFPIAK